MEIEIKYVLDTLWLLISATLVMWMTAGFAMLEVGLTRTRNAVAILAKNISLYALACVMYYATGYALMYGEGNMLLGWGMGLTGFSDGEHNLWADFFFQVVFVATAASIISGAMAERLRYWPFMAFIVVLTGLIYPIQGHWTWGGSTLWGLMDGFKDFAGSVIVHSVGGWAALAGVILLGARTGRYTASGAMRAIPGSNIPLACLGMFILWMGWFGFNGGSQLAIWGKDNAASVSLVLVNTNMAACAGALLAVCYTQLRFHKIDVSMVINGALAGLVAITAGPDYSSPWLAMVIGAVGALLCMLTIPLLDKIKIDDPVGAISVHLVSGTWGGMAVGLFHPEGSLWVQLRGILVIGAFVFVCSYVVWFMLKSSIGIRVDPQNEWDGMDVHEFGMEAYPEFMGRK